MDMGDYLEKLGYRQQKVRNNEYYIRAIKAEILLLFKLYRRLSTGYY